MAIFILLTFLLFFLGTTGWLQQRNVDASWRNAFVWTLVGIFLWVDVTTELLNAIHMLNFGGVVIIWSISLCVGGFWFRMHVRKIVFPKRNSLLHAKGIILLFILLTTALIAAFAFPSNWDSMTYHLARVMQWIHRESLAHYPTNINRQLSQPPLAEYAIMHLFILSPMAQLANWVQWSAYVGSIIAVSLIAKQLGYNDQTQWICALVAATIPMAILQSTSTQNDVVVSFFILCALIMVLHMIKNGIGTQHSVLFWICIVLAMLTKGTAYIFCLPLIATYFIIVMKSRNIRSIAVALISGLLITMTLLSFTWIRNLETFGSPLGPDYDLQNAPVGVTALAVNVPRNVAVHLQTPFNAINESANNVINSYEKMLIGDPEAKAYTWEYSPHTTIGFFSTHEDVAGNALHVLLLSVSVLLLLFRKKYHQQHGLKVVMYILITMFLLFCLILKWQQWHVRLHTPMLFIGSVLIGIMISGSKMGWQRMWMIFFLISALPFLLINTSRPLFWKRNIFNSKPLEMMAMNNHEIFEPYKNITNILLRDHIDTLGFISGGDSWEYPLWMAGKNNDAFMVLNLLPQNETSKLASKDRFNNTIPDALLVKRDIPNDSIYTYRGVTYTRVYAKDSFLLYELQGPQTP